MKHRNLEFIFVTSFGVICLIAIFLGIYFRFNKDTTHIETNDNKELKPNIFYFKDKRTNLCFCEIDTYTKTSSTILVPCDSIKNELLK